MHYQFLNGIDVRCLHQLKLKKGYSIIQDDLLKEEYKNVTQGELNKFCFDINTLSSKCKKQLDELVDKDI